MKTEKFIFICIVFTAVSLNGCSLLIHTIRHQPGEITIDTNLPAEESAVVIFSESILVKEYNGIDVKDAWYPKDRTRKMTITMPAGEAHLLFDIYASWSRGQVNYYFEPKDVELKFNFEAGKEYTVSLYAGKNEGNFFIPKQKIIMAIWDRIYSDANPGNNEESHIIKSWELGVF